MGCLVALVLLIPASLLRAMVIRDLWLWFIAPQFHLAPLTLVNAWGLSLLIGFMTLQYQSSPKKEDDLAYSISVACYMILSPLMVWGWGGLIHWWFA